MISLSILLILLLTYLSAFVSASETALFSLPSTKLKAYKNDKNPRKKIIFELLSRSRDLLVTLFMLNTLFNILLQNVASALFGPDGSWILKIGVPLILTLILGEIIPKYYGLQNNVDLAYRVAPIINWVQKAMGPIRRIIVKITTPISRVLFFYLKKEADISREEIKKVIKASENQSLLSSEEQLLITGFLDLQDTEVKELMWPREDILAYDIYQPLSKLTHLFVEEGCTRIPVIRQSIDDFLGVIDAYTYFIHEPSIKEANDLIKYLKKPFFIPETTLAKTLLKKLTLEGKELALGVDEYGAITGLITKEDLLEVVVGQIVDSRDQDWLFTKENENEVIASGKWELSEFNHHFNANLISKNGYVTLGGWIVEQTGDIPASGTKIEKDKFEFKILSSTPARIEKIFIKRIK